MLERRPGQPDDALCHSSTITSMVWGRTSAIRARQSATCACTLEPTSPAVRPPVEHEVQLDGHLALVTRDLDALAGELAHPLDLERSIGRVGCEHVGRDDRMAFH